MLDPVVTPVKDMERHHLFPDGYLKALGHHRNGPASTPSRTWRSSTGPTTSPSPTGPLPSTGTAMTAGMDPKRLQRQIELHALPVGWEQLDYDEFCEKRRTLIGQVVSEGFERLWDGIVRTRRAHRARFDDLIADGESNVLEFKQSARWSHGTDMKGKSEQIIAKSIAGFMNGEGGTLLIGVADDGADHWSRQRLRHAQQGRS